MRTRLASVGVAAAVACAAAALGQHATESTPRKPVALLSGLGSHRHPIATPVPEAQKFFDQGMILLFGFNHDESFLSFEKAAALDPKSPMPHWGMALAVGANYNDPEPEVNRLKRARAEVDKALALAKTAPENERAYVEALSRRYVADPAAADKAQLARDYNAAMRALSQKYPDDLDAATLYAESGMNLRPWKLYRPDGTPEEGTEEIVAVLESVMKRAPDHPGANHFYIHAVEASRHPERALPSAARLETLVPSAGHLVHMPAHIYMRTGSYLAAEKANAVAADVDRQYIRETGATGMYPMMYYNHNVHFESAAAAMAGRHAQAKKAADVLFADALPGVVHDPMVEGFLLQPTFVALRFQKWDDIRKMEDPGPSSRCCARRGSTRARWRPRPRRTRKSRRRCGKPTASPATRSRLARWRGRRTRQPPCSRSPRRCSMPASRRPRATARQRWRAGKKPSRPTTPWRTTSLPAGTTRSASR